MPALRDAGAVVLLREASSSGPGSAHDGDRGRRGDVASDLQVYWAERAADAAFLGGYHAFVGGKVEPADLEVAIAGTFASDIERGAAVGALREVFEETGVLVAAGLASGGESAAGGAELSEARAELAAARADLLSGRPFAEVLRSLGATLDGSLLRPAGRWVTPDFAPRRFDTFFFLALLPRGQEPALRSEELARGEWSAPAQAIDRWQRAEVLVPPPVLHILRALRDGYDATPGGVLERRLVATPHAAGASVERIEFLPGIVLVPIRTKTLPPATHTNAYVIGREDALVVDPPSADPTEAAKLERVIEELLAEGVRLREVVLTHHHFDHVEGTALVRRRFGLPVAAHRETAKRLEGKIVVDRLIDDEQRIDLGGGYVVRALHTPGHTPGHLSLFEEKTKALLTGDNVVGHGTVLIDPPDGDMEAYLASLRRTLEVPARALFGGHGPAIATPEPRIRALLAHRLWREAEVLRAIEAGAGSAEEAAARAYPDTPEPARPLAVRQVMAHLVWLERKGQVRVVEGRYTRGEGLGGSRP